MKIICIGRNYLDHVKELNSNLPTEPVFFLKPDTCIINRNQPFFYPEFSKEIHYETELVVRINKVGKHIQQKFANTYYDELTVGIDFTARDIQRQCQQKGLPWEISKGFDGAAPIGKFVKKDSFDSIQNINLKLNINNQTIQQGNTTDMIFSVDTIISYVSKFITLKMGDIIFTGTPSGVGPVKIGDRLEAFLNDQSLLKVDIK